MILAGASAMHIGGIGIEMLVTIAQTASNVLVALVVLVHIVARNNIYITISDTLHCVLNR